MDYKEKYEEMFDKLNRLLDDCKKKGHIVARVEDIENLFPELKESEDERIRKELIEFVKSRGGFKQEYITWLEKQGEQEPTDKVEPKFHEGEWITNGDYTWKIVEVMPLDYILQSQDGNMVDDTISHVDEQFHSFTIKDAKDGDVFVGNERGIILMFRGIGNTEWNDVIDYHCYYDYHRKDFIVQKGLEYWGNTENNQLKPATKDQRDLLFKKMKEAGYEWNAEKKELKKIDNEIEIPFGAKDSELQEANYYIPQGYYAKIEGDKVVIKKGEKKPAWSEEDELMCNNLVQMLIRLSAESHTNSTSLCYCYPKEIDWLKSLKQKIGG